MKLPPQAWMRKEGAAALLDALDAAAGTTRLVGGAVRDGLLGLEVSDIDLATSLTPEDAAARIEAAGLKAVPTGIQHGTVTAVAPGFHAEVTTLRRDVSTDGRRATVAFTDDWRADAARRDFTINAMNARLPGLEVEDYFGGLADLEARRVRFIGEPLVRIAEDHLRILRFFRFHARFGLGDPDPAALAACTARANDLMALSRERIAGELMKLLAMPDPAPTMALMVERGIWAPVLPEFGADGIARLRRLAPREHDAGVAPDPVRRLAALLPADPETARDVAARLRLSNRERARLAAAARPLPSPTPDPYLLAFEDGAAVAVDRLLLAGVDGVDLARLLAWRAPRVPLSGKDFIARGLAPGPAVSRAVERFRRLWAEAGFPAKPAELDRLAAKAMEDAAQDTSRPVKHS